MSENEEKTEISIQELYQIVTSYIDYLLIKKWKILCFIVTLGAIGAALWCFSEDKYTSSVRFILNEGESAGGGRMAALLSGFGLNGGGASTASNPNRILEISKSQSIINPLLYKEVTHQNIKTGKILLDILSYEKDEEKVETKIQNLIKTEGDVFDPERIRTAMKVKLVKERLIGESGKEGIILTKHSDDTGILTLSATTKSPRLSLWIVENVYEKLNSYYVEKTIEPQETTFRQAKLKADSIEQRIKSLLYQNAKLADSRKASILRTQRVKVQEIEMDLQVSAEAYAQALKNKEIAEFSLNSVTPYFQIIDEAVLPLESEGENLIKKIMLFSLLGGISGVAFFVVRKFITELK